jgi:hypothetical protein
MPSVDVDRSRTDRRPYPANVGELVYAPLKATPSTSLPSAQGHPPVARGTVRLVVDRRVFEGRQLMAKDVVEHGPISLDLVDEIQAKWPG